MSQIGVLRRRAGGGPLLDRVRWCDGFFCKLRGLMFRRELEPGEGLLMVEAQASRVSTSIHMLFMWIPLGVIWLDADMRVVDKVLARPWRPAYLPAAAAMYTLEADISILDQLEIGDQLQFDGLPS